MKNPTRTKQRRAQLGKRNSNYRGGESVDSNGYVTIPAPERGAGGQRKYQHRVKTRARRGEVVHHVNRKRGDNDAGNLKRTRKHPRPSKRFWRP